MPTLLRPLALTALASLAVMACGSEYSASTLPSATEGTHATQAAAAATPAELARLVPADSSLYLQFASLEALERFVRELGAGDGFTLDPSELLSGAGFTTLDAKLVARDRPIGFALALPEGSLMPVITAVLPVTDADAFLRDWQPSQPGESSAKAKGYVGLSTAAGYALADSPAPIAQLPTEIIALHADLGALIESTRPMLDAQLDAAEQMLDSLSGAEAQEQGVDVSSVMEMYFDLGRTMLDSLESIDLTVSESGTLASLELDLTMREGSALADLADGRRVELAAAAARIDPEAAISFLGGGDMTRLMERFEPFYDQVLEIYPEPMRADMAEYITSFQSIYALLGDAVSGDLRFGEKGMSLTMNLAADDPETLRAEYVELVTGLDGTGFLLEGGAPEQVMLGEREATHLNLRLDSEALAEMSGEGEGAEMGVALEELMTRFLGADGAQVYLVPAEGELAFVMTPDENYLASAVRRLGGGGSGVAGYGWVLERFGNASPVMAYRMDIPRMMVEIAELMQDAGGAMPPLPPGLAGQSLPATFCGGFEERSWRAGISLDRRDLAKFVAAMQEQ